MSGWYKCAGLDSPQSRRWCLASPGSWLKIGFTAASFASLRQSCLAAALALILTQMDLWSPLLWPSCVILPYATWDEYHNTQNLSKACPNHFPFFRNSLWAEECRGCETPGTVQCWYQPSLQSRMDSSPWGCLPKWPGDYWYPCERGCQDWVCKRLRDHVFICGSWEWAVGCFEIPGKMWWVQLCHYMHFILNISKFP